MSDKWNKEKSMLHGIRVATESELNKKIVSFKQKGNSFGGLVKKLLEKYFSENT